MENWISIAKRSKNYKIQKQPQNSSSTTFSSSDGTPRYRKNQLTAVPQTSFGRILKMNWLMSHRDRSTNWNLEEWFFLSILACKISTSNTMGKCQQMNRTGKCFPWIVRGEAYLQISIKKYISNFTLYVYYGVISQYCNVAV